MEKIDLKKELKHLYAPSAKVVAAVDVPPLNYLMIDGVGDPNTSGEYVEAIEALYALAYTLKFKIKKGKSKIDYAVMPLEGLWWVDDMRQFSVKNKDAWKWTMMIVQPKYVTKQLVEEAMQEVKEKKNPPALAKI
ncbi:MAG: GyrI-like domain-containing protein, partial [Chloroflexi bacterium]|nr:GyrI-like domain-containing protein [Chloroflexota bacterium]